VKCPDCGSHECPDFAAEIDNQRPTPRPSLRKAIEARMLADRDAAGIPRHHGIITYSELRAALNCYGDAPAIDTDGITKVIAAHMLSYLPAQAPICTTCGQLENYYTTQPRHQAEAVTKYLKGTTE